MFEKDLSDGLLLRWATPDDLQKVPDLVVEVFSTPDTKVESLGERYRKIMVGEGGLMTSDDCLVVVDTKKDGDPVIACTSYWQEMQTYEGIPFNAGRPAWVGVRNAPEYRGKRIMNHIMDALHARSKEDGTMVQVIHGINWYYRQFGYEYGVDYGKRSKVWLSSIPQLDKGSVERLKYRRATIDDIPTMLEFDKAHGHGGAVHVPLSEVWIKGQIEDMQRQDTDKAHVVGKYVLIFEDESDNVVGFCVVTGFGDERDRTLIGIYQIGFASHIDISTVLFSAMRNVVTFAKCEVDEERFQQLTSLGWHVSRWHPVVEAIPSHLRTFAKLPYEDPSYYYRVPDLSTFIKHILPALNLRLKSSLTHKNFTGSVKVSMYTPRYPGFELHIENGVIVNTLPYVKRDQLEDPTVAYFPPLVFLQVLFGRKSIGELEDIFPDVEMEENTEKLLSVIFPKKISIIHHYM
ncbi:hypothetical protein INT44_008613 [Umbelopsis vinacea]|uniref:N-acetyltransferase domain-containing protein n=1 Tax=Umbelopsis vinacea TaxID=44442 RepID=A0A8H7PXU1_9FUNG|nr:hypothetical protein INT44_008613 [Umbelopsis vinacea]